MTAVAPCAHTHCCWARLFQSTKLWAKHLDGYDIVLTTYETLRRDLKSTSSKLQSPLLHCNWWRIVVDEAQMVCSSSSAAAQVTWAASRSVRSLLRWAWGPTLRMHVVSPQMVSALYRQHSWCVSGSPVSNRLKYGALEMVWLCC